MTALSFVDWPQRIGIDNLVVDTQCRRGCISQDVPEPGSLPAAGLGLAIMALALMPRRGSGRARRADDVRKSRA